MTSEQRSRAARGGTARSPSSSRHPSTSSPSHRGRSPTSLQSAVQLATQRPASTSARTSGTESLMASSRTAVLRGRSARRTRRVVRERTPSPGSVALSVGGAALRPRRRSGRADTPAIRQICAGAPRARRRAAEVRVGSELLARLGGSRRRDDATSKVGGPAAARRIRRSTGIAARPRRPRPVVRGRCGLCPRRRHRQLMAPCTTCPSSGTHCARRCASTSSGRPRAQPRARSLESIAN